MPDTAPSAFLAPFAQLAEQAEASAARRNLLDGRDSLPKTERAAWRRVLLGLAMGEGLEEWVVEPVARGLAQAGLGEPAILAFFQTQGRDELRHRDLFYGYVARHWPEEPVARPTAAHAVLYDGLFKPIIAHSAARPLDLLLPLLLYEKTVSGYLTRLIAVATPRLPHLGAMLEDIRRDEARHVAGVTLACRALVARQAPNLAECAWIAALCQLVVLDMDRTAWWKPELRGHMATLGLDADAMARDNQAAFRDVLRLLSGSR